MKPFQNRFRGDWGRPKEAPRPRPMVTALQKKPRVSSRMQFLLLVTLFLRCGIVPADDAPPTDTSPAVKTVIEGRVIYKADSKRRWRYGRYYIKDRKKGHLAEAVVALYSTKLRKMTWPARNAKATIDQKDFRFIPETVAVDVGDTISFTNSDPQIHNVKTSDGAQPFNVNMPKGGKYTVTFKRATGTRRPLRVGCVFHSTMRAWIFVFDHPFHQLTPANGRFRFENMPPGEYRLEMVHPAGKLAWSKQIKITTGEQLMIDIPVSPDNLTEKK